MTDQPTPPAESGGGEAGDGLLRTEEELRVGTATTEAGAFRVRKHVETEHVSDVVSRDVEHADVERVEATEADSGQVETLPDGSLSIPVFEERLVVEKRLVVRERVVVRKHTVSEEQRVEADLRREQVELDVDKDVRDRVRDEDG
jgi:uncharacterized protein (TIGR02271 family)